MSNKTRLGSDWQTHSLRRETIIVFYLFNLPLLIVLIAITGLGPGPGCLFIFWDFYFDFVCWCWDIWAAGWSLDNINSGGLFWSSVITSGHWEREIQADTQYYIYTSTHPTRSREDKEFWGKLPFWSEISPTFCLQLQVGPRKGSINKQYQAQAPNQPDQYHRDIQISLMCWRPKHDPFSHVDITLTVTWVVYIVYSILSIASVSH